MKKIYGGQLGYDNLISKKNFLKNAQIYCNGRTALYYILKKLKENYCSLYSQLLMF